MLRMRKRGDACGEYAERITFFLLTWLNAFEYINTLFQLNSCVRE